VIIIVSFLVYVKMALLGGGGGCSLWFGLVCVFIGYCYVVLLLCIAIRGSYLCL
jgi:hypothetical protein